MTKPQDPARGEAGKFIAGRAPKSPGRPKGITDSERIRAHLVPHQQEVLNKIIELAKAGDPTSQKTYMSYLAAPVRAEGEFVKIPGLAEAASPGEKAQVIIQALATGQISVETGERVMRVLGTYLAAIAQSELELRLQALETGRPVPLPSIPTPLPTWPESPHHEH